MMNDPGVNVVTVQDVDYDRLLGPLPVVAHHVMDTMVMIGLRCSEVRAVVQQLKVNPKKNEMEQLCSGSGSRLFHWLLYVQSARNETEQNLEVVTKHGQLFYRTTRDIKAGEELLVWYSNELVDAFQVPEVNDAYDKDDRRYLCPYCQECFVYPNPLKVHLMYRCHRRLAEVHGLSAVNKFQLDSINRLQLDLYSASMFHRPPTTTPASAPSNNNNKLNSAFTFSFLDVYRRTAVAAAAAAAANTTLGGEKENLTSALPHFQPSDYDHVISANENALKRGLDSTEITPEVSKKLSRTEKPSKNEELMDERLKEPPEVVRGSGSAFKKVSKTSSSVSKSGFDAYVNGRHSPNYPITSYLTPTGSPPAASMANLSSPSTPVGCWGGLTTSASSNTSASPPSPPPPSANAFSLLNGVTSPYVTVSPRPNNHSFNGCEVDTPAMLTVSYRNAVYTDSMYQLSVNLHGYGSSANASGPSKPLPAVAPPPLTSPTLPQPPLTALLPPSLAALAFPSQNWCAKCNATFRMTSDLVYHMRSHHKKDPDPLKKKREDKLRCQICNESFRERHHLTRHMTSHN